MKTLLSIVICFMVMLPCFVYAQDTVHNPHFTFSTPMQTGVTGYWFPQNDTIAVGTFLTVLRVEHSSLPLWSIDLDGTLAKEVNENKDTLAGIGLKLNYNVNYTDDTGFVFVPSLGVTVMNSIKSFDTIVMDFRPAVYGSVVLYKFK